MGDIKCELGVPWQRAGEAARRLEIEWGRVAPCRFLQLQAVVEYAFHRAPRRGRFGVPLSGVCE